MTAIALIVYAFLMQTASPSKIQITVYIRPEVKEAIEKDRLRLGQTQSLWIERACEKALKGKHK